VKVIKYFLGEDSFLYRLATFFRGLVASFGQKISDVRWLAIPGECIQLIKLLRFLVQVTDPRKTFYEKVDAVIDIVIDVASSSFQVNAIQVLPTVF